MKGSTNTQKDTHGNSGGALLLLSSLRYLYLWVRIKLSRLMGHKVQGKTAIWAHQGRFDPLPVTYVQPYNERDVEISMHLLNKPVDEITPKPRLRDRVLQFLHRLLEALHQL